MKKIRVITKRPGCPPRSVWMSDSLKAFQAAVGGYIEAVPLATDLVILCNEEGRIRGLEPNCQICGVDFVGPIVFVGVQGENFTDLPISFDAFKACFPELWKEAGA